MKTTRKPIRRRSARMAKLMREYLVRKAQFFAKHPKCAIYPFLEATQIHHRKGRLGKLLLDEQYWMAVSQEGHSFIQDHPALAYDMGWLEKRNL